MIVLVFLAIGAHRAKRGPRRLALGLIVDILDLLSSRVYIKNFFKFIACPIVKDAVMGMFGCQAA